MALKLIIAFYTKAEKSLGKSLCPSGHEKDLFAKPYIVRDINRCIGEGKDVLNQSSRANHYSFPGGRADLRGRGSLVVEFPRFWSWKWNVDQGLTSSSVKNDAVYLYSSFLHVSRRLRGVKISLVARFQSVAR